MEKPSSSQQRVDEKAQWEQQRSRSSRSQSSRLAPKAVKSNPVNVVSLESTYASGPVKEKEMDKENTRVRHACRQCQLRKAKCDSELPCSRCRQLRLECEYSASKRETNQKKNRMVAIKASMYETLLRDLMPHLDASRRQIVQETIVMANTEPELETETGDHAPVGPDEVVKDEWNVNADSGSPHHQDRVDRSRAGYTKGEGFVGKASVTRWMEDAGEKADEQAEEEQGR